MGEEPTSLRPFDISLAVKRFAGNELINEEDAKNPAAVERLDRVNRQSGGQYDRWEWAEICPDKDSEVRYLGHVNRNGELIFDSHGSEKVRAPFRIAITPKAAKLGVFQVNQQRDVRSIRPLTTSGYSVDIPLLNAQLLGMKVTKNPTNHVKVAWVYPDSKNFTFELWEVAVVSQYSDVHDVVNLFLTEQLVYTSRVYRVGGVVVLPDYPGWADWPGLRALFPEIQALKLPSLPKIVKKGRTAPELKDGQGWVDWYSRSSGAGVLITNEGPAKVGFAHIVAGSGKFPVFRELTPGNLVQFDELVTPEDPRTQLKLEARGVVQP